MTVYIKNNAIFLHIPKTGGTWVERVLHKLGLVTEKKGHEHADFDRVLYADRLVAAKRLPYLLAMRKLRELTNGLPAEPTKFCFVRNPLSWYESWWRYMQSRGWHDWGIQNTSAKWHPNSGLNGLGSADFNEFVMNVIATRPGYVSELYYSYTKPGITYIGKMETLADDLIKILRLIGHDVDEHTVKGFDRTNVSPREPQPIAWDADVLAAAKVVEMPALLHFGYTKYADVDGQSVLSGIKVNPSLIEGMDMP